MSVAAVANRRDWSALQGDDPGPSSGKLPQPLRAGMAELVDAPDSKSGSGNRVRVQVSLPAPDSRTVECARAAPDRPRESRPGDLPVDRIGRDDVLAVLTPIWSTKPETGRRVRRNIRATLNWCQAHGFVEFNAAGNSINGALPRMFARGAEAVGRLLDRYPLDVPSA